MHACLCPPEGNGTFFCSKSNSFIRKTEDILLRPFCSSHVSNFHREAQLKQQMTDQLGDGATAEEKKKFLKSFFDEEEEAEKATLKKAAPRPNTNLPTTSGHSRPSTTAGNSRYKVELSGNQHPKASPVQVKKSFSDSTLRRSTRGTPRAVGSGSGRRMIDRMSSNRPNTSQNRRARRPDMTIKQPGPIDPAILARLSRPRARPRMTGKISVAPSSASGRWSRPGGGKFSNAKPKTDTEILMLRAAETPGPNQYKLPTFGSGKGGVKISDANPKSNVDIIMRRSAETPGPNQYKADADLNSRLRGGKFSNAKPKTDTEIIMLNAARTPGPNQYKVPSTLVKSGGRFSTAKPKTETEILMLRAAETPGPNQYTLPSFGSVKGGVKISDADPLSNVDLIMLRAEETPGPNQYDMSKYSGTYNMSGGKFNLSKPKTEIELIQSRARLTPGPNQYGLVGTGKIGGGRISTAKPKTETEILMLRSAETPGPNQYVINDAFTRPGTGGAVKISDANPKSDIDWVIFNASQTPAPNQYKPDQDLDSRLKGGRFSSANPKSDLEWTIYNSSLTPGPNAYDLSLCPAPTLINKW